MSERLAWARMKVGQEVWMTVTAYEPGGERDQFPNEFREQAWDLCVGSKEVIKEECRTTTWRKEG